MNPKSILNLFNPKGNAQAAVHQRASTLIISLVVLSLMTLPGFVQPMQASGPEAGGQPSIEVLRNIDPADRKFFSPGYGTLTVRPEETEVLSTIDPADRKFFTPGYGTQNIGADKPKAVLPTTVNELGNQVAIWFLLK